VNQRRDDFESFIPIGEKGADSAIFGRYSLGLASGRDAWVYNFSAEQLKTNVRRMIKNYNEEVAQKGASSGHKPTKDASKISWNRNLETEYSRSRSIDVSENGWRTSIYRPFTRQRSYFDRDMNAMLYQQPRFWPTAVAPNIGFVVMGPRPESNFAALAVDAMPDLAVFTYAVQFFGRWTYESAESAGILDFTVGDEEVVDGYRRIDNITNEALRRFQAAYGSAITKDGIFFYSYGLLHSPDYRQTYAADLKKMLPRIPLVDDPWPFIEAGRELSELHLGYESVKPYPLDGLDVEPTGDPYDFFAVQKMAFMKKRDSETKKLIADKSAIAYNPRIPLSGIPEDAHRYMLGSRSAIEWIIDRYQVKTDKASGIVNDPNDWNREVGDPRYIVDLLARIVTVSLRTMRIVDNLPALAIRQNQNPK
jgi:predicted helicase